MKHPYLSLIHMYEGVWFDLFSTYIYRVLLMCRSYCIYISDLDRFMQRVMAANYEFGVVPYPEATFNTSIHYYQLYLFTL